MHANSGTSAVPVSSPPAENTRSSALRVIEMIVDPGSFTVWDRPPRAIVGDPEYSEQLRDARERAGADESVVTGRGTVRGRPVAVVASEFDFLAGSIGVATVQRIVEAIERATDEGLPLLATPASGGTRMQEGTPAFVGMVSVVLACERHKAAGLPYLVYLRHPTTGGVFASWGSLGHMTFAEPEALVGFLGPRVYETIHGEPFPAGVQQSENLVTHGIVDAVVPIDDVRELVDDVLAVVSVRRGLRLGAVPDHAGHPDPIGPTKPVASVDPWEAVLRSRRPDRPGVEDLLRCCANHVVRLNGTGAGESAPGLILALARFGAAGCVVIGQSGRAQRVGAPLGPAELRVARRGMRLASELGVPLVSIVDTPGADLSPAAEEGALASEIARSIADLLSLEVPTVSVLMGQGCGGGALAMLPADMVIAAENAWLSPLPLEGASVIVHRTVDRAPDMARHQRVGATSLMADGIVDVVVPEGEDAADAPEVFCRRLAGEIETALIGQAPAGLRAVRADRYSSDALRAH